MRQVKYKDLFSYYKINVYEHGYYMCERDKKYNTDHSKPEEDIYFNDEMDYNICAEYYGMNGDFLEEDKAFLAVLGFVPEDFKGEE